MSPENIRGPRRWKVKKSDGSRLEPASLDVLRQWVTSGQIVANDLVINEELADWITASEVVELADLFPESKSRSESTSAQEPFPDPHEKEPEVQVPDCAFHSGRTASEICVGCGKFICEECRRRIDKKVYCRECMAEKEAGVEPGTPVGPGVSGAAVSGAAPSKEISRLAIASLVFLAAAALASVGMVVPRPNIMFALGAGFLAFMAALLGGFAFSRIRQSGDTLGGRRMALSGLVAGSVVLVGTLAMASTLVTQTGLAARGAARRSGAPIRGNTGRRTGALPQIGRLQQGGRDLADSEAGARSLLDQAGDLLNQGRFEEAISKCKEIIRIYPNTRTAELVDDRLPVLIEEFERQRAESEELRQQNESAALQRYEHAIGMFADGDEATALALLRSIVESFPEAETAEKASVMIASNEDRIAAEDLQKLDAEARRLVAEADQLVGAEQYAEALQLYRKVVRKYPKSPTAADAKLSLANVETLVSDPSERAFRRIQKDLEAKTYEESIALLEGFLGEHPTSARVVEARKLLDENSKHRRTADNLYNFGRAYFEDEKYEVALGRFSKLLKDYSRSRWVPQARKEYEETLGNLQE